MKLPYKTYPKTCFVCGTSFNGGKLAIYCSNKCRQENKRNKQRPERVKRCMKK